MTEPADPSIPAEALLLLDTDVAQWLHHMADQYFLGDTARAMNHFLHQAKEQRDYHLAHVDPTLDINAAPPDPWAALQAQLPPWPGTRPPRPEPGQ